GGGGGVTKLCLHVEVNELLTEDAFLIYPNPVVNKFAISFSKAMNNASLEIFNVMGERVYSEYISDTSLNGKEIELKIQSGIYFVRLGNNEKQYVRKIIVE